MSLNFTVTPGKIWVEGEKIDTAKLNQTALPTITASGSTAPADLAAGDYSGKFNPGAYFYTTATLSSATYTTVATVASYVDGLVLAVKVDATNPAVPQLNAGAGDKPLYQHGGRTRVEAGDILANTIVEVRYNSSLNSGNGGWEVTTPIGPRPARSAFQPASAYAGGEQGLVPRPAVGQQNFYLRGDGNWADVVATVQTAIASSVTQLEIYKQQNFI